MLNNMKKLFLVCTIICSLVFISLSSLCANAAGKTNVSIDETAIKKDPVINNKISPLVIITAASSLNDIENTEWLIESLRKFGGMYSDSRFYVIIDPAINAPYDRLKLENVEMIPLTLKPVAAKYPFSLKIYASSMIEKMLEDEDCSLVWLDNHCLFLAQPDDLILDRDIDAAAGRVLLINKVGQSPNEPADAFWSGIYKTAGIDIDDVPVMKPVVDDQEIRLYINCRMVSVKPASGIFREWERVFDKLIKDEEYQEKACFEVRHRIFLHQAVISAILAKKPSAKRLRLFDSSFGYPLNHHEMLPENKRIERLEDVKFLIYDQYIFKNPGWMEFFKVGDPLAGWLKETYQRIFKKTE